MLPHRHLWSAIGIFCLHPVELTVALAAATVATEGLGAAEDRGMETMAAQLQQLLDQRS